MTLLKKMFTREVKVGIITVISIFILYFGLNFLKGIDVFSPINNYYSTYEEIGGLVKSSPVYIKGFKVGQVEAVQYDFTKTPSFIVRFSVDKEISLPKGTQVQLFDDGLMGGKAINLLLPTTQHGVAAANDTLPSTIASGLMDELTAGLLPKLNNMLESVDSLICYVQGQLGNDQIKNSLASVESMTKELEHSAKKLNGMMQQEVPQLVADAKGVMSDFRGVSGQLNSINYKGTFDQLDNTISNLQLLSGKLNSSDNSIGLLLNDTNLYLNLTNTASSADKLLIDLQSNPKRYVHFSLFGKKQK